MAAFRRLDLRVFRKDPLQLTLTVVGIDLTGATQLDFAVRLYPDAPGAKLINCALTTTPGAQGCRLVSVTTDGGGVPTSVIEILDTKATMAALPAAGEAGDDTVLHHDFQWLRAADGSGLTMIEETKLFGQFIVMGSVND